MFSFVNKSKDGIAETFLSHSQHISNGSFENGKKHFLLKNKNPFILHFLLEGKIFYRGKKEIRKRERRGKRKKENVTKKERSI